MRAGVKEVGLNELRGLKSLHISWVRLSALINSNDGRCKGSWVEGVEGIKTVTYKLG